MPKPLGVPTAVPCPGHSAFPLNHPALQDGLLLVPLGALGDTLLRSNAAGYALAALVLFTLKDAASRGRLGASTFKALNIGKQCWLCFYLEKLGENGGACCALWQRGQQLLACRQA